jgi:ABC-2 type transport system permease protein
MRAELIVAGKEFRDHLTSKRFLVVFGILVLVCIYAVATGMGNYNKMLDDYKKSSQQSQQQPWYQERLAELQKQIAEAEARGAAPEEIDMLRYELDMLVNPPMPSMMYVFSDLNRLFVLVGMVLSVSMGFDLITREREEGSLKSLLSHPVYRDSVINGKAIGAVSVLGVVLAAAFLLTIAIMLFYGVVPKTEEFLRIAAYFVLAMLYCLVFFALALMTSAVAKNSSLSVLYVLGIIVALVMVSQFSYQIVELVTGPPPDIGEPILYAEIPAAADEKASLSSYAPPSDSREPADAAEPAPPDAGILPVPVPPMEKNDEYQKYWERRQMIQDALNSLSPMTNFGERIAYTVLSDGNQFVYLDVKMAAESRVAGGMLGQKMTVWDSLSSVKWNVLVLLVQVIIAFAIAYVMFLRVDVR